MKKLLQISFLLFFAGLATGQKNYFSNPVDGFSKKKTSYITLTDGTELVGNVKKFDRKKGMFEGITIEANGKKHKLESEDIAHMYLMPSGLQKLANAFDLTDDAEKVVDHSLNAELFEQGYVYFVQTECYYKKSKKQTLLMQLLNSGFSSKVKVFHNPWAQESMSVGIGGMKLAGGNEKSYFIQNGDDTAFKLKRKNYKETAGELFGDCKDFFKSIKGDLDWSKLGMDIMDYTTSCP